jgi:hypothetical protein
MILDTKIVLVDDNLRVERTPEAVVVNEEGFEGFGN